MGNLVDKLHAKFETGKERAGLEEMDERLGYMLRGSREWGMNELK